MRPKRLKTWLSWWVRENQGEGGGPDKPTRARAEVSASLQPEQTQPGEVSQPSPHQSDVEPLIGSRSLVSPTESPAATSDRSAQSAAPLQEALAAVWNELRDRATSASFEHLLQDVFGSTTNPATVFTEAASQLAKQIAAGDQLGLRFSLLNGTTMGAAAGAYAAAGIDGEPTVFINSDWLQAATPEQLRLVLLEEIGHHFDQLLNGHLDTAGDEGELFAILLSGKTLTNNELTTILNDDDNGSLLINGQRIATEFAITSTGVSSSTLGATSSTQTLNRTTAEAITVTVTYDSNNGDGADILIAAYNNTTLIGWSIYNRLRNLDAGKGGSATATLDLTFNLAQFNPNIQSGGLTLRAWQGAAGGSTPVGTGDDTTPAITSGTSSTVPFTVNTNGARTNDSPVPSTTTGATAGGSSTWSNIRVDAIAPTVQSVAISSATGAQNSTLNAGDVVSVSVTMSETVNVSGTPQLTLNIGGVNRTANYSSGSGSATLLFSYTVQAGDTDANGIAIAANSLSLNGGSIADTAGNGATLTHAAVADNASYLVDTTAPNAPVLSLGSGVSGGASAAEATAAGGVISLTAESGSSVSVTFSRSGGGSVSKSVTGNGSTPVAVVLSSADLSTLGDGSITVNATATDAAGNSSSAANTSFSLDTTAPATPSLALAADTGASNSDRITSNTSINVGGLETGASWEYSTNSGSTWTAGSGSSFTLSSGSYASGQIRVRQTDLAGNTSNANTSFAAFTIDVDAPVAPTLALRNDTGPRRRDGITSDAVVVVSGLEAGAASMFSVDGGENWLNFTGGNIQLSEGLYDIGKVRVRQIDAAGNFSTGQNTSTWVIDQTAPGFLSGTSCSLNENSGSDQVVYTPILNGSEALTSNIVFYSLAASADSSLFTVDTFTGSVRLTVNPDYESRSNYSFILRATDLAGLSSERTVTLNILDLDEQAPSAPAINAVETNDIINAAEAADGVVISGSAEGGSSVAITWGSITKTVTASGSSSGTGTWSTTFDSLELPADGTSTITATATATDSAGNRSAAGSRNVLLDRATPGRPTLAPVGGDNVINAAEKAAGITLSGSAEAGSSITVSWNGSTRITTADASTGAWSLVYTSAQSRLIPPPAPSPSPPQIWLATSPLPSPAPFASTPQLPMLR